MPFGIAQLRVHHTPDAAAGIWCHAVLSAAAEGDSISQGDVRLMNEAGEIAIEITGVRLRPVVVDAIGDALFGFEW